MILPTHKALSRSTPIVSPPSNSAFHNFLLALNIVGFFGISFPDAQNSNYQNYLQGNAGTTTSAPSGPTSTTTTTTTTGPTATVCVLSPQRVISTDISLRRLLTIILLLALDLEVSSLRTALARPGRRSSYWNVVAHRQLKPVAPMMPLGPSQPT